MQGDRRSHYAREELKGDSKCESESEYRRYGINEFWEAAADRPEVDRSEPRRMGKMGRKNRNKSKSDSKVTTLGKTTER